MRYKHVYVCIYKLYIESLKDKFISELQPCKVQPPQLMWAIQNAIKRECLMGLTFGKLVNKISGQKDICIDFGHKDTKYKLKLGRLKFGESQMICQIHKTFPLYSITLTQMVVTYTHTRAHTHAHTYYTHTHTHAHTHTLFTN